MPIKKYQRGMTIWSASFVIGVFVFFIFLGFKLFPVYMDDLKVKSALDSISRLPDVGSMSKADMAAALDKRFDIDNVSTVKPAQHLFLEARGGTRIIRISYEAVVPLFYNISALLEFDHVREVRGAQ